MCSEHITGEIKEIQSDLAQARRTPVHLHPPAGTVRLIDVQIYDVPAQDFAEDLFSMESSIETEGGSTLDPSSLPDGNQEQLSQESLEPLENTLPRRTRLHPLPLVLAVLCVLFAGAISVVYVLPLFAPSATVTIIPDSLQITTTSTISVVTGTANNEYQQLQGRMLSSLTISQAQTIPTTGIGHQDAQAAHGRITFYNAAPYEQTVAAGTLIIGRDGVQVVTDRDAVMSAAVYPTFGQVTVPAHVVTIGPEGNIRAGDIYGPCCRLNVSAVNGAFGGGQNARSYHMVTLQDIHGVVTSITAGLANSVQAALQTQVQPDETLITPVPCQQAVTSDHTAGDEAAQVQITVDETCSGVVFNTWAYHDLTRRIVTQQAFKQLPEGYTLSRDIKAKIDAVTIKRHGEVDLAVTGTGTWGYQFSQDELQRLKTMIAGKTEMQARAALLHVAGVQTVSITFKNATIIPTDTSTIHLVLVEML